MDGEPIANLLFCEDADFQIAITMAKVLLQHTLKVYQTLIAVEPSGINGSKISNRELFFNELPSGFDRQGYLSIAKRMKIPDKTAEKMIDAFLKGGLLKRISHGNYSKN